MNPGRELDALIAEKVMGLTLNQPDNCDWTPNTYVYAINGYDLNGPVYVLDCPHYSTDIKAAWEVVEKTEILKGYLLYQHDNGWELQDHSERPFCSGSTAPHVICLAALKAVGYEDEPRSGAV